MVSSVPSQFKLDCKKNYRENETVKCIIYTLGSNITVNVEPQGKPIETISVADSPIHGYGIDVPYYQAKPKYLDNNQHDYWKGVSLATIVRSGGIVSGIEFYGTPGTYTFMVS